MPGLNGVEATRRIRSGVPGTRVLVLTMYDDDATVFTATQAGAQGYLLEDAEHEEIVRAIRVAGSDEAIVGPGVAERVIGDFADPPVSAGGAYPFPELTQRGARGPLGRRHVECSMDRGGVRPPASEDRSLPERA